MSIANFPTALQPIIQTNYLDRRFEQSLRSVLAYREVADRMTFPNRVGQTFTDTRAGLKAPATTPLNPSNNTNFDNGLSASAWAVEQYTLTMNMYGDTIDLNVLTDRVGIANQFVQNAVVNGVQAAQTLERLARDALFNAGFAGNTRVRTTLGAPAATVSVDDIRGFQNVWVNGVVTPVSNSNPVTVTIGSNAYSIGAVAADGSNVSTAPNGISGTLTTVSGNITVSDGTAGNAAQASFASTILRPNGRSNTSTLAAGDVLTMGNLLDAVAVLRKNAVPTLASGFYNCYLDPVSARQLFADADFKELFRAMNGGMPETFRRGEMASDFLGLRFIPTTEAYIQSAPNVANAVVRRPIIVGAGALIEGDFEGMGASETASADSIVSMVDGVAMVTREPLDRFQQIVAQSWYWVGGFTAPTDITTSTSIVPTATNSAWKRMVMIEHIG